MGPNNLQTFINKQYKLSLAQSTPLGFSVSAVSGNSFTLRNVGEGALPQLQILAASISYNVSIMVTSVGVTTSNGTMVNPLFQNTLNDAIPIRQSVRGVETPFAIGFGAANVSVNTAADVYNSVINNPTENLVKTYNLTLTAVSLGADVGYSNVTGSKKTDDGCYSWFSNNGMNFVSICRNKYITKYGGHATTCNLCNRG